jgi:hypothetical protein
VDIINYVCWSSTKWTSTKGGGLVQSGHHQLRVLV